MKRYFADNKGLRAQPRWHEDLLYLIFRVFTRALRALYLSYARYQ